MTKNGNPSPATHRCIERARLQRFAQGRLAQAEIDEVASAIEQCPQCQAALETVDAARDDLLLTLREQGDDFPAADPSQLEDLLVAAELAGWESLSAAGPRAAQTLPQEDAGETAQPLIIGQYHLLERLQSGGMGAVYRALHARLKRPAAVKILAGHRPNDAGAIARFQREMEAIGRLDHPHIVRALDAGEADGQHFLAMELLAGMDAARLVRQRGRLEIADACEIVRQACAGIDYAHRQGLLHRDVKPSNLMLTPEGTVKVLDLGLARFSQPAEDAGTLTSDGHVLGTGDFVAPEQGLDARTADERSDIYSLGCTLYFLLAGEPPFATEGRDTFTKKVLAHVHHQPRSLAQRRAEVPAELAAIVERAMAKSPAARFASAGDMAAALAPFAAGNQLAQLLKRGDALPQKVAAASGDVAPAQRSTARASPATSPARKWPSRLSLIAMGVLATYALVATVLGALAWSESRRAQQRIMRAGDSPRLADEVNLPLPQPEGRGEPDKDDAIPPARAVDGAALPRPVEDGGRAKPRVHMRPIKLPWVYEEHKADRHRPTSLLIHGQGFGCISRVQGRFGGWAEKVRVEIGDNHVWGATGAGVEFGVDVKAHAYSVETRDYKPVSIAVNAYRWQSPSDSIRMLHKDEGICVLTGIQGGLQAPEHLMGIALTDDGFYELAGKSTDKNAVCEVTAVRLSQERSLAAEVEEYHWQAGDESVKMIHRDEGICFLSLIGGPWNRPGDEARVWIAEDGFWYLSGGDAEMKAFAQAIAVRIFGDAVR